MWEMRTKKRIIEVLRWHVEEMMRKREWAMHVMLAEEERGKKIVAMAYLGFKIYLKIAKK
jgi:hypothetical protein